MYCPILLHAFYTQPLDLGQQGHMVIHDTQCKEVQCAWWNKKTKKCSIADAVDSLASICNTICI